MLSTIELRENLESKMRAQFGNFVLYGPYRGMILAKENYWSPDNPAMRFGLYEKEISDFLKNFRGNTFINIGAGDGYYTVGQVFNQSFAKTICFEMSIKGQEKIQELGKLNGVIEKIVINGEAGVNQLDQCENQLNNSLVLCDIEGSEFDIFSNYHFHRLAKSAIIIEIHDWIDEAENKIKKLIDDSSATHDTKVVRTGSRDLSEFPELAKFSDEERWLTVMEGRPSLMSWFLFTPKLMH